MRTGSDYVFVNADAEKIEAEITSVYQSLTQRIVCNASPEKLFIQWITAALVQAYISINTAGNQNIPSRAEGENLDALGQLFFSRTRPMAKAASVKMRFTISSAQKTALLIPAGTRVSTEAGMITFSTEEDTYIPAGQTEIETPCICDSTGITGNGYMPGAISTCVDPFPYYASCVNVDESDGGSDAATDDEYYELMVASEDAYSCAGSRGSYEYFAKSVSTDIADVLVNSPSAGRVNIYILMKDGKPAGEEIRRAALAACSAEEVRPLTDYVTVETPDLIFFDINLKYYISKDTEESAQAIEAAVNAAVQKYIAWQCGKIGRDINPSRLIQMVVAAGAKRVEVTSPVFARLHDGEDNSRPQLAQISNMAILNGGYEDE